MSSVRYAFPKLKLSSQLKEAGGITVVEAVEAAESNLRGLRPECLDELRSIVSEATACLGGMSTGFDAKSLHRLYAISSSGVGRGVVAGTPVIDEVLVSLCDLVDHFLATGQCHREALAVHVNSLQLVLPDAAAPASEAAVTAILSGLKKVNLRYGRASTGQPQASSA